MSLMQWGLNWLTDMNWLKENERMSLKLVMQGKSEDELLAKIRAEGRKAPNICMSCASLQASHLTKFGGAMFFKEPFLFPSAILLHPAAAASLFFESVVETCSIPTLVISWTPYCYNFTPTNPTCLGVPIAHFQDFPRAWSVQRREATEAEIEAIIILWFPTLAVIRLAQKLLSPAKTLILFRRKHIFPKWRSLNVWIILSHDSITIGFYSCLWILTSSFDRNS